MNQYPDKDGEINAAEHSQSPHGSEEISLPETESTTDAPAGNGLSSAPAGHKADDFSEADDFSSEDDFNEDGGFFDEDESHLPEFKGDEDFASMFAGTEVAVTSVKKGEKLKAIIVSIPTDGEHIILDVGPKNIGMIEKRELLNKDGELELKVGDCVEANVVSVKNGEVLLSRTLSAKHQSSEDLQVAFKNKIPLKGKVIGENKGGFDLTILGKKAFCPVSQMDTAYIEDKTKYLGKDFEFLIEKLENGGRDIVVSRSALLKIQEEKKIKALIATMTPNSIFTGNVVQIREFGAFVDLGGIQGMVHISHVSHSRVSDINEELSIGDQVSVKILNVERINEKYKISLSMKDAQENPWDAFERNMKTGDSCQGRVVKLMNFGAFVELIPGVEGLIHISQLSWERNVRHPNEVVNEGDIVQVSILSIDPETRRISLSMKDIEADPWYNIADKYPVGKTVEGTVERLRNFGAIVNLAPGLSGLIPISDLKNTFQDGYRKKCCPPNKLAVVIREVDTSGKKISLALPQSNSDTEDSRNYQEYMQEKKIQPEETQVVGSFGSLLMEKLKRNN